MDQKNFETARDHLRSCESSSLDHAYSLELIAHVETLQLERAELLAALKALVDNPVRYSCERIEIECESHTDAMKRVRAARAALTKATGV